MHLTSGFRCRLNVMQSLAHSRCSINVLSWGFILLWCLLNRIAVCLFNSYVIFFLPFSLNSGRCLQCIVHFRGLPCFLSLIICPFRLVPKKCPACALSASPMRRRHLVASKEIRPLWCLRMKTGPSVWLRFLGTQLQETGDCRLL